MSPLQWNPKVVAITVIAGVILLYAATAILPGRQKTEETSRRREEHDAFKSANLEGPEDLEKFHPTKAHNQKDLETKEKQIASARGDDSKTKMNVRAEDTQVENAVPEGILEASEKTKLSLVDIEEKRIIFNTGGKSIQIFYREAAGKKLPVLLLHGKAFHSSHWVQVETIQMLSRMGHRVVAVDLPGFGQSKESKVSDKEQFLQDFISKLDLGRPVIVSPSMSGSFALPFILKGSSAERVSGYVPIAPPKASAFTEAEYKAAKIPVLIVYGSKDRRFGVEGSVHLKQFPNHKVFVVKDAGHPAWIEKPKVWNTALYNFIKLFDKV